MRSPRERMVVSARLTPAFVEAVQYAAEKHATQTRKASDTPYLGQLLSVAGLVIEADAESRMGRP
jgi:(p)ppGpp synthase/HD superfamily hydrolase